MTEIRFARLTEVPFGEIVQHMSDPRVAEHMPLLTMEWDETVAASFVAKKEAFWAHDGLGHWAIYADNTYAGWGGFQKEGSEWDFGLVLKPEFFGLGGQISRRALAFARKDPRIPFVTFLLPPTRRNLSVFKRVGARHIGDIEYAGARFLKYRLETG